MDKSSGQLKLVFGLVILLLILGFYLPLLHFFFGSNPFHPEEPLFEWSYLIQFLSDPWNLRVIWFSFYQAFWSAILAVLFGLPGAWILSRFDFPGKRIFRILSYLPFILPSILVVLGMILFFGNNGFVNQFLQWTFALEEPPFQFLYSLKGILIAHVFYNFPIATKTIGDQWERLSTKYSQAALLLGANLWKVFIRVHLPLLLPSIFSSFVLIFLLCMNSFAIILVLGSGVRFTNMEVLIYQLARVELDIQGAACVAFLQLFLSMGFLFSLFRGVDKTIAQEIIAKKPLFAEIKKGSGSALLSLVWLTLVVIFAFGPLLSIVADSLRKFENNQWVFTLQWYAKLFTSGEGNTFLNSLWNSFKIGLSSALLSSFLGLGMAVMIHQTKGWRRKSWEVVALFPIGLSTVIFGVAWYTFFQGKVLDILGLTVILITIHAVLTFPYWIRVVLPSLDSVPPQWLMASQSLGKTPTQYFFQILIPWLRRALLIGFFFSFSLSLGELNSTMMVADETLRTLPLEIYRAIAGYRFSYASAVGVVLLLVTVITFSVVEEIVE